MRFNLIVFLLVILLIGCTQPKSSLAPQLSPELKMTPAPQPMPGKPPSFNFKAKPMKSFFMPGEEVEIAIVFENTGSEPITIAPYPPEIRLIKHHDSEIVYTSKPSGKELKLMPREKSTYTLRWKSSTSISPGFYYVEVITRVHEPNNSWSLKANVCKILIQHPQGAMEKTIKINQTQTVDNVTIVLEKVELTSTGGNVYIFAKLPTLPETSSPLIPLPEPTPPPPPESYRAVYKVDNSDEKPAFSAGLRWVNGDLRITWQIEPIPADAKKMTFIISELGKWKGPWIFHIDLER